MSNETEISKLPKDIFQREAIAESMCELICSAPADAISPVVLQGPWGSGKSTHAKRMMKCIQKNYADTHKCIYWNASIYDYAADPLPLFVANLYSETAPNEREEFTRVGFKLCGNTAVAVTKEFINQLIANSSGFDLKSIAEAATEAQEKAKKPNLQQFKTFLEEAGTDKIRIDTAKELLDLARGDKKLIVIIDELDRCRPGFALQMIETIKHLFTNENCKFILIMNKQSIVESICNTHGLGQSNAETYLNKFIKLSLQLPNYALNRRHSTDYNCKYFSYLLNLSFKFNQPIGFSEIVSALIKNKKLQLREIERWVRTLTHLLKINNINSLEDIENVHLFIIVIISYLISFDMEAAFMLAEKSTYTHELMERLGIQGCDLKISTPYSYKHIELKDVFSCYFALETKKEESFFKDIDDDFIISRIIDYANFLKTWIQHSLFIHHI